MIKTKFLIKIVTIISIASLVSVSAVSNIVFATEITSNTDGIDEQKDISLNNEALPEFDMISESKVDGIVDVLHVSDVTEETQVTKSDDKTNETADKFEVVRDDTANDTTDTTEKSWLATELEDNQPFINATTVALNKLENDVQKSDLEKITTLRVIGASSIPEKISDYTALSSLIVSSGTISSIPEGLYALNRTLRVLDIKNNNFIVLPDKLFETKFWTSQITGLTVLCDNNQIVSNIPRDIGATSMLDFNSRNNMLEYYNITDYHNNPQAQLMYRGVPTVTVPVGYDFKTALPDTTDLFVYVTARGYQDLFLGHEFVYYDDGNSPVIQNGVAMRAGSGRIWVKSKFSTASNPFAKTQIRVTVTAPVVAGDVTVKYIDTAGHTISEDIVKFGNVGEAYTTEQKNIEGYIFKEVRGAVIGKFTTAPQTITYVYEKDEDKATVVVRDSELTVGDSWHPEDNFVSATDYYGNSIPFLDINVEGTVNTSVVGSYKITYTQQIPSFVNNAEEQGNYSATAMIIVKDAIPVKGGNITTTYVDTDGNSISEDVVKIGYVGEAYITEQKDIEDYSFKEVQGEVSGNFTDQPQAIVYIYTKNKSDLIKPELKPNSDNQRTNKDDNHQDKDFSSSNQQQALPETGENASMILMRISLGVILSAIALLALMFRFKQNKIKNNIRKL